MEMFSASVQIRKRTEMAKFDVMNYQETMLLWTTCIDLIILQERQHPQFRKVQKLRTTVIVQLMSFGCIFIFNLM
jgi:hypothetical protein